MVYFIHISMPTFSLSGHHQGSTCFQFHSKNIFIWKTINEKVEEKLIGLSTLSRLPFVIKWRHVFVFENFKSNVFYFILYIFFHSAQLILWHVNLHSLLLESKQTP